MTARPTRPKPRPGRPGARPRRTAALVELARRFLAEGATVEPWADIWAALRHPDGRTVCVPDTVLRQARETPGEGETPRRVARPERPRTGEG